MVGAKCRKYLIQTFVWARSSGEPLVAKGETINQQKKENKKMKKTISALMIAVLVAGCNSPKKLLKQ